MFAPLSRWNCLKGGFSRRKGKSQFGADDLYVGGKIIEDIDVSTL
jgi:hypothetical protein